MTQETKLFFSSIIHEDRGVMDLLTADYSFVNERLARHYGIPECLWQPIPAHQNHRRITAWAVGAGQHSYHHLISQPDLSSAAREMDSDQRTGNRLTPPPPNVPELKENGENAAPSRCGSAWRRTAPTPFAPVAIR